LAELNVWTDGLNDPPLTVLEEVEREFLRRTLSHARALGEIADLLKKL